MANPGCDHREMDVALSLVDLSTNIGRPMSQNQNGPANDNTPTQGQNFQGLPGRARAARNRAVRNGHRAIRSAGETNGHHNQTTRNTGRNEHRQQEPAPFARPVAHMPPQGQPQPQFHPGMQAPGVNPAFTLQGHLIRQQLLAGIAPENVVTMGPRAPGVPNPNANVHGRGMPAMLQITNDGVFVPPLPPATFVPPGPRPIPYGHRYQENAVPAQAWARTGHQPHQMPIYPRPATSWGPTTFGGPAPGTRWNGEAPAPVPREPRIEENASAGHTFATVEGIPPRPRSISEHPVIKLEANSPMPARPASNGPTKREYFSPNHFWNVVENRPENSMSAKGRFPAVPSAINPTYHNQANTSEPDIHKQEGDCHVEHFIATEPLLEYETSSFERPTNAIGVNNAGYVLGQLDAPGSTEIPSHQVVEEFGLASMANQIERPASIANANNGLQNREPSSVATENNAEHSSKTLNGNHLGSSAFVQGEPSSDRPVNTMKHMPDYSHASSSAVASQGPRGELSSGALDPNQEGRSFNSPVIIKDEAAVGHAAIGKHSTPTGSQVGDASVKNEPPAQKPKMLGRLAYRLDHLINHPPSPAQGSSDVKLEDFSGNFQPALKETHPTTSQQDGSSDSNANAAATAIHPDANSGSSQSQHPVTNKAVSSEDVPQDSNAAAKREPMPGSEIGNPQNQNTYDSGFRILLPLLGHPVVAILVTEHLHVQDIVQLQIASQAYRSFIVKYHPLIIRLQAGKNSPMASKLFPWRCYSKLWLQRAMIGFRLVPLTNDIPENSAIACLASFTWLQMIIHRENTVSSILDALRPAGYGVPRTFASAILKLWFLMDVPDNSRRLWTVRNRSLWTDLDLFMAIFFIVRIDMFVKIHRNNHSGGQRRLIMAQPSLEFCHRVLTGRALTTNDELVRALIRWRYVPRHGEVFGQYLHGVPIPEVGRLQYEGYGRRRGPGVKLLRPDELILDEIRKRRLNTQEIYRRVFIYCQPHLFTHCERPNILWDDELKLATHNCNIPFRKALTLDEF